MGFSRSGLDHHRQENNNQQQQLREGSNFMAATNNNSSKSATDHQINPSQHHHHQQYQLMQHQSSSSTSHHLMMQHPSSSSSIPPNFISHKDSSSTGGAYDLGELDQALFLYFDGHDPSSSPSPSSTHHHHHLQDQQQRQNSSSSMRPPTLNIFPSQPMHVEPSPKVTPVLLNSPSTSGSKRPPEPSMDQLANRRAGVGAATGTEAPTKPVKREGNRKGATSSSEQDGPKTPDPKTLRRLAQNREAARKSRLRKKAYIQNLESSRIKLTQLEQELHRARGQGIIVGGGGGGMMGGDQGLPVMNMNSISADAAVFNMEYTRWTEEHHRLMCELRAAVQEHLPESELRLFVDNCLAHYDELITLKTMVAKSDVFHLVSGMWKTPAERCFMWMGDFRPSELIKVILNQLEPLTEQQLMGICGLQQSTQEAEEALSQGLEALNQSLTDTITSDSLSCPPNMANYMGQMAIAMNKLSTLEGFVRQADNLRHQTIHRLLQLLTTRQGARCLIAIAEYFNRLRTLSSLWVTRPRQD